MDRCFFKMAALGLPVFIGAISAEPAAADDLADMRQEIQALRQQYDGALQRLQKDYEGKLQQMEKRVKAAEAKAQAAQEAAEAARTPPPAVAQSEAPAPADAAAPSAAPVPAPPPVATGGGAPASASAFNPAIGAVLMGQTTAQTRNPNDFRIPGFALGDNAGQLPRGFAINESELN